VYGVGVTPQGDTIASFIIAAATRVQTYPSVVFNGVDYVVVWSDNRNESFDIGLIRVTPEGTVPVPVCWLAQGANDEEDPDIAFDGYRCLAVWSEEGVGVRGRFVNDLVLPEDTIFTIADFEITDYTSPQVACDGDNYLVVWYDRRPGGSDWDVYGQLVSHLGELIGDRITIATGSQSQYHAHVVFDGVYYFVVWREANFDIYGQFINTDGNLHGPGIRISDNTSVYRFTPDVTFSSTNFLVAWIEYHGGHADIYGNVDVLTDIQEDTIVTQPRAIEYKATILSGPLVLPEGKNCKVFDVCGKLVAPDEVVPGIYFLEIEENQVHKIIKVR
jgi:hypothetical protein